MKRNWKVIIPVVALGVGWQHVRSTFQWNKVEEEEPTDLKLINYNVRVFNVYDHDKDFYDPAIPSRMLSWLSNQDAGVLCLQEYYNDPESAVYNTQVQLRENGFKHDYVLANKHNGVGQQFGLAIFSKFPIVKRGAISFPHEDHNTAIFADIVVNSDTVRFYNVHLYSMKIRMYGIKEDLNVLKSTFYRLKEGFQSHAIEVEILKDHILKSPHSVILAGDLNELPYGYTYLTLKDILVNSFEEKGRGFGFTYGHRPSFIRIDNQFSSASIGIKSHKVHNEVTFSDHFPISVVYQTKEKIGKSK